LIEMARQPKTPKTAAQINDVGFRMPEDAMVPAKAVLPESAPSASVKPAAAHHASGHRERLRNRLIANGGDSLQPYEALELVLCGFIPRRDVKPIAKALIARFGGVSAALAASPLELSKVDGVGEVTAAYLKAIHVLHTHAALEEVAAAGDLQLGGAVELCPSEAPA
jgi:DNA repair protein RadC